MLRQSIQVSCLLAASFLACFGFTARAAMSSTNYQVLWDAVNVGGSDTGTSSGGTYQLRDSIGEISSGRPSGTGYTVSTGYRSGIYDPVVNIVYYIQDKNSQVASTILADLTVTVTTSAGFAEGDLIAVVQDEGGSQITAVGEIAALTATTLTVDAWTTNGSSPSIDGLDDYVYALDASSLALGGLTPYGVTTGIIAWEVTADVSQGYGVYVADNGQPQLSGGSDTLADVADGTVTAGQPEYGGNSSDSSLSTSTFDTQDTAFTTTPQLVASRSDNTFSSRDFLTIEMAMPSGQASGSYSGTLMLVLVGDY